MKEKRKMKRVRKGERDEVSRIELVTRTPRVREKEGNEREVKEKREKERRREGEKKG